MSGLSIINYVQFLPKQYCETSQNRLRGHQLTAFNRYQLNLAVITKTSYSVDRLANEMTCFWTAHKLKLLSR